MYWRILQTKYNWMQFLVLYVVGNKVKGRISKRIFQENKARQIFRKTNISYLLIRTRTYVCVSGIRTVRFSGNLACFVFLKLPFWNSPFCLITNDMSVHSSKREKHDQGPKWNRKYKRIRTFKKCYKEKIELSKRRAVWFCLSIYIVTINASVTRRAQIG